MIELNAWLFMYGVAWALVGQMGALYFVVRTLEARARRRAKANAQQKQALKIWRPGEQ